MLNTLLALLILGMLLALYLSTSQQAHPDREDQRLDADGACPEASPWVVLSTGFVLAASMLLVPSCETDPCLDAIFVATYPDWCV